MAQRLDANGNVLASYMFDGFGTRGSTDNSSDPFSGYGGQWGYYSDWETGLQLLGHRYYDSSAGRFLTRDPIHYAGGINLYNYVGNGPLAGIDPQGLQPESVDKEPCDDDQDSEMERKHNSPDEGFVAPDLGFGSGDEGSSGVPVDPPGTDPENAPWGQLGEGRANDPRVEAEDATADSGSSVPDLQFAHSENTLRSGSGYRYWSNKSTQEIIDSLRPEAEDPLTVYSDGVISDGNTRIRILMDRGVDVNRLPRVPRNRISYPDP